MQIYLEIGIDGSLGYFDGGDEETFENFNAIKLSNNTEIKAKTIYTYVNGNGTIKYIVVSQDSKLYELIFDYLGEKIDLNNILL